MTMMSGMSIRQFCNSVGISAALYFKLKRQGKGPPTVRIGKRVVILHSDAEKWIEENRL
jgi:predicted DNA-binding transcriptional regulator AlpA